MFYKIIKVFEYDSNAILRNTKLTKGVGLSNSIKNTSELRISFLKFAVSMVKANTISGNNIIEQAFDIMTNSLNLYGLIDSGNSFSFKEGFRIKYRDFSRTSRIGEISQAINYILAQEVIGYKYIFDYDEFLRAISFHAKLSGGKPDYVMLDALKSKVALLESKGSSQKNKLTPSQIKNKLKNAIENQCKQGAVHLNASSYPISNSFASVVEISEVNDGRESAVYFCDPEYSEISEDGFNLAIKSYYLKWLNFVFLSDGEYIKDFNNFNFDELSIYPFKGREYYVQKNYFDINGFKMNFKFGLDKEVVNRLKISDFRGVKNMDLNKFSDLGVEIFTDGAIAISSDIQVSIFMRTIFSGSLDKTPTFKSDL